MTAGVLSIGTNSTRALVADLSGDRPKVLLARSTGTRLGEGLRERGRIDEAAAQRTLHALEAHTAAVRALTGDYCAIATSAMRRAENADEFARRVRECTGVALDIISGEEEARRSFSGALAGLPAAMRSGVLDLGGGSSEYATGSRAQLDRAVSLEIGAVRLSESHAELTGEHGVVPANVVEDARRDARAALQPLAAFNHVERVIFVGGTATTSVCVLRGQRFDFEYEPVTQDGLDSLIARFARTPLAQRKTIAGINPQRADILLAGLLILREVFAITGHRQALVSTNDLLLGTLLERKR